MKLKSLLTANNLILIAIITIAAALRLYHLSSMPALNADEAAIGYNAYSLILTGKDEHGASWPLVFKSFGDYKPGLYFYLVLPFVKILGLTELAVRLPSALLGITSVWLIYLLAGELSPTNISHPRHTPPPLIHNSSFLIQPLAALLLAISPWHIHFSRGGWETNVATFFLLAGVLLFLKATSPTTPGVACLKPLKNKGASPGVNVSGLFLLSSVFCFLFSFYTYHSMRIVAPLLGLTLVVLFRRQLFAKSNLKWTLASAVAGTLILVPFVLLFFSSAGASRFSGVSIFADTGPYWRVNQLRGEHPNFTNLPAKILHNQPLAYTLQFGQNYLDHFWGEFLFLTGDEIQRNKVPETGLFYLFQFPLLIIGIYQLLHTKKSRHPEPDEVGSKNPLRNQDSALKGKIFILAWLFIAPIPAALTFQSPHALRAHNLVIPLTLLSALGLTTITNVISNLPALNRVEGFQNPLRNHLFKFLFLLTTYSLILITTLFEFTRYLHQYYSHLAKTYPYSSQYGFQQLAAWIHDHYQDYPQFVITDRYDQPYILTLFYLQYPPEQFQQQVQLTPRDRFGFSTVRHFDKFYFETIDFPQTRLDHPHAVIITAPEELSSPASPIYQIPFPSGQPAFLILPPAGS
jgi:4-amino-4-deoxy-L-arabinose transferase-like glycosyltransferase